MGSVERNNDPFSQLLHRDLYASLETLFENPHAITRLAYDGMLWSIRSGIVRDPSVTVLNDGELQLTVKRACHIPELYGIELQHPAIHPTYFEYSKLGGMALGRDMVASGTEANAGQLYRMNQMVLHTTFEPHLAVDAAYDITRAYLQGHPHETLHPDVAEQYMLDCLIADDQPRAT